MVIQITNSTDMKGILYRLSPIKIGPFYFLHFLTEISFLNYTHNFPHINNSPRKLFIQVVPYILHIFLAVSNDIPLTFAINSILNKFYDSFQYHNTCSL
jgi:hypothetical protein